MCSLLFSLDRKVFRQCTDSRPAGEWALRTWSLVGDRVCPQVRATIFQPAKQDMNGFVLPSRANIRLHYDRGRLPKIGEKAYHG